MSHAEARATVWPSTCFYWSVLSVAEGGEHRARRAAPSRPALSHPAKEFLDSLFEDDLPLPLDDVHTSYSSLHDGRFLACAVPRASLVHLSPEVLSLVADSVPAALGLARISPPELLTGEFEPLPLRRERSVRWLIAAGACLVAAALGTTGLLRRAAHADLLARQLDSASLKLTREALPSAPADLALAANHLRRALDELRPLYLKPAATASTPDAARTLTTLLSSLPRATSLRTDVLAVTPTSITLNVATDADPQVFLKSLAAPIGWRLEEPRLSVSRGDGSSALAIQMRRAEVLP